MTKKCSRCGEVKPCGAFHEKRKSKDGLRSECKECRRAESRSWSATSIEYRRNYHLKGAYGISYADKVRMAQAQDFRCPICGVQFTVDELHVDHDHESGAIRELLCPSHNKGLGFFGDSPDLLRRGADYIERHLERLAEAA